MWVVETVQIKQNCLTTYPRNFLLSRSLTASHLSEKQRAENCLATFNMISNYLKIWDFFATLRPIFKITSVNQNDISDLKVTYVEERNFVSTSKMLISSLTLQNGCDHSSPCIFCRIGQCLHKNLLSRWLHTKERFQQLCAISSKRIKRSWRDFYFTCCGRHNKADGHGLQWL